MYFHNSIFLVDTLKEENSTASSNDSSPFSIYEYHQQDMILLIVILVGFIMLSYYLYYSAKNNIRKAKNTYTDTNARFSKYRNLINLSLANLIRSMSILYILLVSNKSGDDLISFFNYFCHILPSIIFFSVFFCYIEFLIEKYYEIKTKKKDMFFSPSVQFFSIFIYVMFFVTTISCLSSRMYRTFMYLGTAFISVLSFITGILFLYYGVRIASIYSPDSENREIKEKKTIHNRVLIVSFVVGITYITRGCLCFFISIGAFKDIYPTFMCINMWDFFTFFFNELLCSFAIGYTRQRDEKVRQEDSLNMENFDLNQNFTNLVQVAKDENKEVKIVMELQDPLLDQFEKEG